jgi:hypothetical protein
MIVFDIETGSIPDDELQELFTFDESSVKGFDLLSKEFDPKEVKLGNMKDPQKIQEKIDAAREKFETEKSGATALIETSRDSAWKAFKRQAALSPLTGQVLAIGYYSMNWKGMGDAFRLDCINDTTRTERQVIEFALETFDRFLAEGMPIVGHNIIGFDLPFLLRRAAKYKIKPPRSILLQLQQYKPNALIDTMRLWQLGNRTEKFPKLDELAGFFGVTRKNGDGANFGTLFNGTADERLTAIEYLENDVKMTKEIYERLEVLHV